MTAIVAIPSAAYLLLKPKSTGDADLVEVADLNHMEIGAPQEVVFYRTRVDGWKTTKDKTTAWVVKTDPQNAIAFSPQCPHLGCPYHWEDDTMEFRCPCHDSVFSTDGTVVAGPAPRPLDRYTAKVEGGKLLIGSVIRKV